MRARPNSDKQRLIQLDVLRGVAILLVLCNHWVIHPNGSGKLELLARTLMNIGWSGVVLFFVLSGFLIGGLLMQELQTFGKLDVKRFLVRRAFKIWPVYYLYLAFLLVSLTRGSAGNWAHAVHQLMPNLVHIQNYTNHEQLIASHTWSLAVEEQFYLLLPVLLLVLSFANFKRIHWIPWIAVGFSVVCLALRLAHHGHVFHPWTVQNLTHLRVDSLFTGVLLAYWYHFQPDVFYRIARHRRLLLFIAVVCLCPVAVYQVSKTAFIWTFGYTMLSIGYGSLLVLFVSTTPGEGRLGNWLESGPARSIAYIGVFSYSIYVWHPDLVQHPLRNLCDNGLLVNESASFRWLTMTILSMGSSVLVGIVLAKAVESPALAIRNRLFPARASAVTIDS